MLNRIPAKIEQVVSETYDTVSLRFNACIQAAPGNFIMLTDYENGEKPFSFSEVTPDSFVITVRKRGAFTEAIAKKKPGEFLYFSGPWGNSFQFPENTKSKIIILGGGCGTAPMRFLLYSLLAKGFTDLTLINGARSARDLLYHNQFSEISELKYIVVTDDGSIGEKMLTPDKFREISATENYQYLYSAGPEMMMKVLLEQISDIDINAQFLLERYMKCGIGICGQCTLDPLGIRLCVEGPVLGRELLSKSTEFGNYTRDVFGARTTFSHCTF